MVDPVAYEAASQAVGTEIAGRVSRTGWGLLDELAACVAMAGADPGGQAWAEAYDQAAAVALGVTADVANACYQLAALLAQCGFNYGRAESWSTPGVWEAVPDPVAYAGCTVALARPPSAAGGSVPVPSQWWLIERAVGYVWPDGHQGRLRAAGAAWTSAAMAIGEATLYVQEALHCLAAQLSPEVEDAMTACRSMDEHLWQLAGGYRDLARACTEYADHLDRAHAEIGHQLISLMEWTAGLQIAGGVLAFFTAGLSEVPAQLVQTERLAATAAKVRAIITDLIAAADLLAETITATTTRALGISCHLRDLLGTRLSAATMEKAAQLPELTRTAEHIAVSELTRAQQATVRVDRVLARLRAGRRTPNLEVDTREDLDKVWTELSAGGTPISSGFPGKHLQLPDGTTIGYRAYSKSGGATIEIAKTDGTLIKVHMS